MMMYRSVVFLQGDDYVTFSNMIDAELPEGSVFAGMSDAERAYAYLSEWFHSVDECDAPSHVDPTGTVDAVSYIYDGCVVDAPIIGGFIIGERFGRYASLDLIVD